MTEAHIRPATQQRFWERIRDRYRGRRGFLRSRARLVHRRPVRLAAAATARVRPVAPIARQQFVLQIHLHTLAWPPGIGRHGGSPDATRRQALETLLTLGRPSAPSHTLPGQAHQPPATSPVVGRAIGSPVMAPAARTIAGRSSGAPGSARIAPEPMMTTRRVPDRAGLPAPPRPAGSQQTMPRQRLALAGRAGTSHESGIPATVPGRVVRSVQPGAASTHLASAVSGPDIAPTGSRPLVHAARQPLLEDAGRDQSSAVDRVARAPRHAIGGELPSLFPHLSLTELAPASRPAREARTGRSTGQRESASRLFAGPVTRSFAIPPAGSPAHDAPPQPRAAQPPPPEIRTPAPPPIDLERLTEDVYHHLQRRMRIERERRGL